MGSSSKINFGSDINALAISSNFRWPPDSVAAYSSRMCESLKRSNRSSAFSKISFSCFCQREGKRAFLRDSPFCSAAPKSMLSITVIFARDFVN